MRIRRIKGIEDKLADYGSYLPADVSKKGRWNDFFPCPHQPLIAEFGCGKGSFGIELARRHPEKNVLCVDVVPEVMIKAVRKKDIPANLKFTLLDLKQTASLFEDGELHKIFLNFSDPWPKKRHYKRRLTYRDFLAEYRRILQNGAEIEFKTDNRPLFEFSLLEFSHMNCRLQFLSLDLHEEEPEDNIRTEYETKFSSRGSKIYKAVAIV